MRDKLEIDKVRQTMKRRGGQSVPIELKCLVALNLQQRQKAKQREIASRLFVSQSVVANILAKLYSYFCTNSPQATAAEQNGFRRKRLTDRSFLLTFALTPDLCLELLQEKKRGGGQHSRKLGTDVQHAEFLIQLLDKVSFIFVISTICHIVFFLFY